MKKQGLCDVSSICNMWIQGSQLGTVSTVEWRDSRNWVLGSPFLVMTGEENRTNPFHWEQLFLMFVFNLLESIKKKKLRQQRIIRSTQEKLKIQRDPEHKVTST